MTPLDLIDKFLDSYEAAWNALDYAALRALWSDDEAEPWWLPEEVDRPLVGWNEVERYWRDCQRLIDRFGVRTWDRRIKRIADDVAVAMFMMKWTVVTHGASSAPIGGTVKVSVVLRYDEAWHVVHYMEAALGPLPFVRAAYAAAAEPGLLRE